METVDKKKTSVKQSKETPKPEGSKEIIGPEEYDPQEIESTDDEQDTSNTERRGSEEIDEEIPELANHQEEIDEDEYDEDDENDDTVFNENIDEQKDEIEIEFDPRKHIQHLTLNEMTRIIININDMINNDVLSISLSETKADFIYNAIVNNKFDIVIRRPIDLRTILRVNLSQLKIDKIKLRQKLDTLFS